MRPGILVVAAVVALAGGGFAWYVTAPAAPPPIDLAPPIEPAAPSDLETAMPAPIDRFPEALTVHVSGAVAAPGLVVVVHGSRVADALVAAGGVTADAELDAVNLAAPLGDGEHVHVPVAPVGSGTPGGAVAPGGKVRLNQAGAAELEALPGVGPVTAGRIVAHRETNGPFLVVEDLLDVPGIGEGKLAALRDAVIVP